MSSRITNKDLGKPLTRLRRRTLATWTAPRTVSAAMVDIPFVNPTWLEAWSEQISSNGESSQSSGNSCGRTRRRESLEFCLVRSSAG